MQKIPLVVRIVYLFFSAVCFAFTYATSSSFLQNRLGPTLDVMATVTGYQEVASRRGSGNNYPMLEFQVGTLTFSKLDTGVGMPVVGEKIPLQIDTETHEPVKVSSLWFLIVPLVMFLSGASLLVVGLKMKTKISLKPFLKWVLVLFGGYFLLLGSWLIFDSWEVSQNTKVVTITGREEKVPVKDRDGGQFDFGYYRVVYESLGKTYQSYLRCETGVCGEEVKFKLWIDERAPGIPLTEEPQSTPQIIMSFIVGLFLLGVGVMVPRMKRIN